MPYKDPIVRAAFLKEYQEKNREKLFKYKQEYRAKNAEKLRAEKAAWRAANRPRLIAKNKQYYQDNKHLWPEKTKKWKEANRDRVRAAALEQYYKHKERYLENGRKWRAANRERQRATERLRHAKNPEKARARWAKYRKDPHYIAMSRAHATIRRSRKVTPSLNFKDVKAFYKFVTSSMTIECCYCGIKIPGTKAHIDHFIPLAKGGLHELDNLRASCRKCNQSKGGKLYEEWMQTRQADKNYVSTYG